VRGRWLIASTRNGPSKWIKSRMRIAFIYMHIHLNLHKRITLNTRRIHVCMCLTAHEKTHTHTHTHTHKSQSHIFTYSRHARLSLYTENTYSTSKTLHIIGISNCVKFALLFPCSTEDSLPHPWQDQSNLRETIPVNPVGVSAVHYRHQKTPPTETKLTLMTK